jgi:hypothetical protein
MIPVMFRDITARLTRAVRFNGRPFDTEIAPDRRETTQTCTATWSRIVTSMAERIKAENG